MNTPAINSLWASSDGQVFRVIAVVALDNHTWVHYVNRSTGQEYSCYAESFLARFKETPK